jgi:GMP synthase (glutamine-hydrolysing)
MRIIILVAGRTIPAIAAVRGDFPHWFQEQTGDAWRGEWATYDLQGAEPLPRPRAAAAFIITGSSSSVTDAAPWMQRAETLVRDIAATTIPLLGVCFGHQLIAHALGGEVRKNPLGREIGTVQARRLVDDPLFAWLPRTFHVNASHVDSVVRPPRGACVLATTRLDPVSAFRVGTSVWGVQFHPEFDADVMRRYVEARGHLVKEEGGDPDALLADVHDRTRGPAVLQNFARLVPEPSGTSLD